MVASRILGVIGGNKMDESQLESIAKEKQSKEHIPILVQLMGDSYGNLYYASRKNVKKKISSVMPIGQPCWICSDDPFKLFRRNWKDFVEGDRLDLVDIMPKITSDDDRDAAFERTYSLLKSSKRVGLFIGAGLDTYAAAATLHCIQFYRILKEEDI